MKWGKANPKETGWYLVTVADGVFDKTVMPLYRVEYPPGNLYWDGLSHGKVIASIKFPNPAEVEG